MNNVSCRLVLLISLFAACPADLPAGETGDLTISEAVGISLSNNLGLKLERITPDEEKEKIGIAESEFDPNVTASASVAGTETRDDPETESLENGMTAGVGKKFAYGTTIATEIFLSDDSQTDSAGGDSDGTSVLTTLRVTQPLLKNRGTVVNRRNVVIAENNHKKSELAFRQAVIDTVAETKNLYWQLYSAVRNLTVREKSLDLAGKFLSEVEEKVKIGSAARLDTLQARAEVASREGDVIAAENDVMNRHDTLATYIYGDLKGARQIRCVQPPSFEAVRVDEPAFIQTAMTQRTDYRQAEFDVASAETDVTFARNQTNPQLDLVGTVGYNQGDSDNTQTAEHRDYHTGTLSLNLRFPWGFRKEAADYRVAKFSLDRSRIRLGQIESQIMLEIRTASRNVTSAHKQYLTASLAARLAEEKLAAEQEKYDRGLSTSYDVLLYQRDLTDAGVKLVDATIGYQLAIVSLNKAVGITLEENSIRVPEDVR